jgi:ABC-type Fe3+ transport system substrate-binding protein
VAAAQKEGEVDIVSGPEGVQMDGPWFAAFEKQYGIKVVITGGATKDITAKIEAERAQGVYSIDIASLGGTGTNNFAKDGFFDKLDPLLINPEVKDRSTGWLVNHPVYTSTDLIGICEYVAVQSEPNMITMYYNTEKVTKAELDSVTSWQDFLKPEWKGRIVIGDVASGEADRDVGTIWSVLGKSWYDGLFANTPGVVAYGGERQYADDLINGKFAVGMFPPGSASLDQAQTDGLPVAAWEKTLKEGSPNSGIQRVCPMKNMPHPNAGQLLANWMLMKDGQTALNALTGRKDRCSLRTDVPQGIVDATLWARAHDPKTVFVDDTNAAWTQTLADVKVYLKAKFTELGIVPGS